MIKREAKATVLFRHWLKANPAAFPYSCAFELKQTTGSSLRFDAVEDHQIAALEAANSDKGILYKAPDDSRGVKPFDLFLLKDVPAFIVIKYPSKFEVISVAQFKRERAKSKARSLTANRASEISIFSIRTKK